MGRLRQDGPRRRKAREAAGKGLCWGVVGLGRKVAVAGRTAIARYRSLSRAKRLAIVGYLVATSSIRLGLIAFRGDPLWTLALLPVCLFQAWCFAGMFWNARERRRENEAIRRLVEEDERLRADLERGRIDLPARRGVGPTP